MMNAAVRSNSELQTRPLKTLLFAAALASLASSAFAALPGDSTDGKRLHDASCVGCHDTGVYTRKTRSVQSLGALKQQLDSCGHASGRELSSSQKQNVIKYLNDHFYRFRDDGK
jgi:hypothetical protein